MTGLLRVFARVVVLLAALIPTLARGVTFPVFAGDPTDPGTGDPYFIFPGLPLILPSPNGHGEKPVVDTTKIGDVDLVVRAGTAIVGPDIPSPVDPPLTGVAGGSHVADGTEIPFTVAVTDGQTPAPLGSPLLGTEMDGLPVVVVVFADLDGDGIVGPTNADPEGAADNARELQEALYPVGRQVALFANGVATGSVAVAVGAPASAGGLHVVLTAAAYVGPLDSLAGAPNIPDGPPIATLFPFLPRIEKGTVVEGGGRGGRAGSDVRVSFELEPAVAPLVEDHTLGTPFAIPTDGTSPTVDRAVITSGPFARARFVRPSVAAGFPTGAPVPVHAGANGTLVEPLDTLEVPDDGPGGAVAARLVPVDRLDNVTDPPPHTIVTLLAGPGLLIVAPDTDGDPSTETVALDTAAGIEVMLGDSGAANDSGTGATLTVASGGFPIETLAIHFTPGGISTTTTTVSTTTSVSTTTPTTVPTTTTAPDASSTTVSTTSTSTTTVAPSTTTSTTLPPGCPPGPSLTGVACRLATLAAAIDQEVATGALHDRFATYVGQARARVERATQLANDRRGRPAHAALRQAGAALASLADRLRSRRAARLLVPAVRARLLADADALQRELRVLRQTLPSA